MVGMLLSMFFAAKAGAACFHSNAKNTGTRAMYCILYTFYAARIGFADFSMGSSWSVSTIPPMIFFARLHV